MKRDKSTIKGTDQNLTGVPMLNNQIQPKGIMQVSQEKMGTMIQFQNFKFCEDPKQELKLSTGALIRKQIDTVSGSVAQNKYFILLQSPNGLKITFKNIESSPKNLVMRILHLKSTKEIITDICEVYARAEEKRGCSFCKCLFSCKHKLEVKLEPYQTRIGGVIIGNDYQIYDDRGNELYIIEYRNGEFGILKNDEEAGFIKKKIMSIGNNFPAAETYEISFPSDATIESKLIIIFATMLIDHENFEKEPNENEKNQ